MRPLQEKYKEGRLGEGTHRIQRERRKERKKKMIEKKKKEREKRREHSFTLRKRGARHLPHMHAHRNFFQRAEEEEEGYIHLHCALIVQFENEGRKV